MREIHHRVLGANSVPAEIWIDSLDDALAIIFKEREGQEFRFLHEQTVQQFPALLPWILRYPLRALELANQWPRLMQVAAWLQEHPRPSIYVRQIDLPGIDSKFIEQHKTVLSEYSTSHCLRARLTVPRPDRQALHGGTVSAKNRF